MSENAQCTYDTYDLIKKAQAGDRDASEKMVSENTGLIWSVAKRFFGRGVDADDLYQLGCVGFLKAVYGFDTQYGTQFSTYAVPKIAGEIRRFLRDDGAVKVSRGVKERAYAIRKAKESLEQKLGREPYLSEIAAATGFEAEDIAMCENATAATDSLQRETGDEGFTLEQMIGDTKQEETLIEHVALREAISSLAEKEQMVIVLRYYRGLTQNQTAKIIGISQVQVSRVEKKAVEKLRKYLE